MGRAERESPRRGTRESFTVQRGLHRSECPLPVNRRIFIVTEANTPWPRTGGHFLFHRAILPPHFSPVGLYPLHRGLLCSALWMKGRLMIEGIALGLLGFVGLAISIFGLVTQKKSPRIAFAALATAILYSLYTYRVVWDDPQSFLVILCFAFPVVIALISAWRQFAR